MEKRSALGKGLSALIPDAPDAADRVSLEVEIDRLEPNTYQPRGAVDRERLADLTRSIQVNGVIQPIVVRRLPADTGGSGPLGAAAARYQIIAGERRWRAAQQAGLRTVPIVVKDVGAADRRQLLEMALVENIQREDLNPIEEAEAFQRLATEFGLRQEDIAAQVGRDRSSVANSLRLLKLPEEVRTEVAAGRLSMGHARAVVALPTEAEQRRVAREVLARGLSVRETEALVKKLAASPHAGSTPDATARNDVHTRAAEEQLRMTLGTRVAIKRRGKGGRIEIAFGSESELQRIYEFLTDTRR